MENSVGSVLEPDLVNPSYLLTRDVRCDVLANGILGSRPVSDDVLCFEERPVLIASLLVSARQCCSRFVEALYSIEATVIWAQFQPAL